MRCRAAKARIGGRETWLCVDMQGAPVRILVRTDIDWRRMERTDFLNQSDPTRPLAFISSAPLDLWERAFDVDFFSYRAQLQDLAYATFREAGADSMTVGFSDFESWWASSEEEIIVPIDDDDLLLGPLSFLTYEFTDDVDVALWPRATIVLEEDGSMGWRCPETRCIFATNSALRKSFLRRRFHRDEVVKILADHALANDRIGEVLGVPRDDTALPGFRRLRHPPRGVPPAELLAEERTRGVDPAARADDEKGRPDRVPKGADSRGAAADPRLRRATRGAGGRAREGVGVPADRRRVVPMVAAGADLTLRCAATSPWHRAASHADPASG